MTVFITNSSQYGAEADGMGGGRGGRATEKMLENRPEDALGKLIPLVNLVNLVKLVKLLKLVKLVKL